jgi:hypothetical protein
MMATGTGSTTAASKPSLVGLVPVLSCHHINNPTGRRIVIYRSKDKKLPNFFQSDELVGDIFFDVNTTLSFLSRYLDLQVDANFCGIAKRAGG